MVDATLLGGRYRLLDPLGRGGMGTVYEAVQEGLGRRVAVKLLDPRLAADRGQLERFRREAEVVAALGHPNIVQVTDFEYAEPDPTLRAPGDNQQPFLVMELLRGESLGSAIARQSALPFGRVAFIAAQVLSALSAAHRAGVVHRDVKPDNIFLLSDAAVPDTVKVLDFGIAKLADDGLMGGQAKLTGTGAMLGTPAFMAPEQARGALDVDPRADVYAVGATMYQALSGRLPYEAPSIPALLFAIVEQSPPPLTELRPDVPAELVAIVERAMAKDREGRFPDAEAMRRALSPWSGLPASIPPPVSVTAATIADSGQPSAGAVRTPVLVHKTPPPNVSTVKPIEPPKRRSIAVLVMSTVIAIVAVLTLGAVLIVSIIMKERPALKPEEVASAASAPVLGQATAHEVPSVATSGALAPAVASASASAAASPPQAPVRHRYSGSTGHQSGSDFSDCKQCDWEGFRNDMGLKVGEVSACYKASLHDPPLHQSQYYKVGVTDSGAFTTFELQGDEPVPPKLDRCLTDLIRRTPLKKPGGPAGSFRDRLH